MIERFKTKKGIVSIAVFAVLFIFQLIYNFSGNTEMVLLSSSSQSGVGQVFWKTATKDYQEPMSKTYKLKAGEINTIRIAFPDEIEQATAFRLDPINVSNTNVQISYVSICKSGYRPLTVPINEINNIGGISSLTVSNVLRLKSANNDPMLSFKAPAFDFKIDWISILLLFIYSLLFALLVPLCWSFFNRIKYDAYSIFVVAAISIVFGLSICMAMTARYNASPDEQDHFLAAEYFKTNSIVPIKYSNEGVYTYNSLWAYSRVYQKGLHYLIAGKFSNLFDGSVNSFASVRLFGVFLIFSLLIIILRFPKHSLIILPFILTPQTWYLHSYINDGYYPLFISFVILLISEVNKNRLLSGDFSLGNITASLILGVCLGSLFISKSNYILFYFFYIIYLLTIVLNIDFNVLLNKKLDVNIIKNIKERIKLPGIVIVVAIVTLLGHNTFTQKAEVNVTPNVQSFYDNAKVQKEELFKQARSGKDHFGSYTKMMHPWLESSYISFNGGYGYMKYFNSKTFTKILAVFHFISLGLIIFFLYRSKEYNLIILGLLVFAFVILMLIMSSFGFSYLYDYQAQGRYLFPILPVWGLFLYKIKDIKGFAYIYLSFVPMFILGIYSFVFIGLNNL